MWEVSMTATAYVTVMDTETVISRYIGMILHVRTASPVRSCSMQGVDVDKKNSGPLKVLPVNQSINQ